MKLSRLALAAFGAAVLFGSTAPTTAFAQASGTDKVEKPWMVRLRVLKLDTANKSDAFSALETNFPKNAVHVADKTFPEVDISYFFTKNIATELVLTYPQRHDVSLEGVGKLGTIDHLPPTLMAQYHFVIPNAPIEPYVGAGVNYTRITRARLAVAGVPLEVGRSSVGFAYQIGADFKVADNLYLNLDYKHLKLDTDVKVKADGTKLTNARLDPDLLSIGIGVRF